MYKLRYTHVCMLTHTLMLQSKFPSEENNIGQHYNSNIILLGSKPMVCQKEQTVLNCTSTFYAVFILVCMNVCVCVCVYV